MPPTPLQPPPPSHLPPLPPPPRVDSLKLEVNFLNDIVEQNTKEIVSLKASLVKAQSEVFDANAKEFQAKKDLERLRLEIDVQKGEIDEVKEEVEKERLSHKRKVDEMTNELSNAYKNLSVCQEKEEREKTEKKE